MFRRLFWRARIRQFLLVTYGATMGHDANRIPTRPVARMLTQAYNNGRLFGLAFAYLPLV